MPIIRGQESNWTYLGLIDDKVSIYPWKGSEGFNKFEFDRILRFSALFDYPLLINDGYLVNYSWSRKDLQNPKSLLRRLIASKRISVFSKRSDGRIDLMIEEEAEHVDSYRRLRDGDNWKVLKPILEEFCKSSNYYYTQWPKMSLFDNRIGFDRISEDIFGGKIEETMLEDIPSKLVNNFYSDYQTERSKYPLTGARTSWENVIKNNNSYSPHSQNLMNIANEVYHYNLAMAFCASYGVDMKVSTIASRGTCSRYSTFAEPVTIPQIGFEKKFNQLSDSEFVALVDSTQEIRNKVLDAINSHSEKSNSDEISDKISEYKEDLVSWISSNTKVEKRKRLSAHKVGVSGGVLFTVAAATAPLYVGVATIPLVATVGAFSTLSVLSTSGVIPHLVTAWQFRDLKSLSKKAFGVKKQKQTNLVTGSFSISKIEAKNHFERSRK